MRFDSKGLWLACLSLSIALASGCGSPAPIAAVDAFVEQDAHTADDAAADDDASVEDDASTEVDANVETDASTEADASTDDASSPICAPAGIGAACDSEGACQTGLRCYTGSAGDFCSVDRAPDCGGFVMARCAASAPYCLRPIGSSLGACATEAEAICICAIAGDRIQAGEGTEGCPAPPRP